MSVLYDGSFASYAQPVATIKPLITRSTPASVTFTVSARLEASRSNVQRRSRATKLVRAGENELVAESTLNSGLCDVVASAPEGDSPVAIIRAAAAPAVRPSFEVTDPPM